MKTNQLMEVAFSSGKIEVFHKTAMGDLSQLWAIGNSLRTMEGRGAANLTRFLESSKTKEFIAVLEKRGITPFQVSGRGNKRKTWASIHVMIYAAEYLSPEFHFEVIDAFITGKLLEYRDESGDQFKAMNLAIDNYWPKPEGKDNKGKFVQVAKMIRLKVDPEMQGWNFATAEQLQQRLKYENSITEMLRLGVVKDFNHLKELIEKL